MKTLNVKQGSEEWLHARAGIPTASELDSLISPTGKIRTGQTPHTYLCRKLAEAWNGGPLQSFSGGVMEQGAILESEAVPWFELRTGLDVERVGFLLTDDGFFGASPDGMLPDGTGLEIKCPQPTNHIAWLLAGDVPDEHRLQCHGGMYVTGAERWTFVSYCRGFPALVCELRRDEVVIELIRDALDDFRVAFNDGWKRIEKANGGNKAATTTTDDHTF